MILPASQLIQSLIKICWGLTEKSARLDKFFYAQVCEGLTMPIGIGVNGWIWTSPFTNESLPLLNKAAALGFDAFTIPIEDPALLTPQRIKSSLADTSLRVSVTGAFGPNRDLTHSDPRFRQESLTYIRDMLEICEKIGAKMLVGPMYSATGKRRHLSSEQRKFEWDLAVSGLHKAAIMAADHGVMLAIEPLNRFETDLVNTTEQAKRLIADVGHKSVGIHLDTFHMHIEEKSVYDAIVLAGSDLIYFDASESDRGTPGSGQVHWDEVARGLADIGYSGDCTIESFTPECLTIAAAAAIWRPLAISQDALAAEGLRYLRKLL